ncbi:hypothetical protein JYU34_013189 [Plutella xylostella]|uniref:Uncharacterized protein n=1 Tax=Plutella xylostella TaxID=51655 RepID=A0ABQ7QDM3_PLUXY|nr:hypothetical protein JYU34_013189 [Plutella xylostella]
MMAPRCLFRQTNRQICILDFIRQLKLQREPDKSLLLMEPGASGGGGGAGRGGGVHSG